MGEIRTLRRESMTAVRIVIESEIPTERFEDEAEWNSLLGDLFHTVEDACGFGVFIHAEKVPRS